MKPNKLKLNLIFNAKRILSSVLLFIFYFTSSFGQYDTLKLIDYLPIFYVYSATGVNWTEIDEIYTYYDNGWHEPDDGWGGFTGGWDGRGKAIYAQPASSSATVGELSLSNIHSISTSIGLYEGAGSSVDFVIQVFDGSNYHTKLDTIISEPNTQFFYNIDLSAWYGQEITLRFITDPNGFDFYDWSYWGEPKAVIGPFESDIKIEEIISPNQQFKINDKDKIKVKISNNGLKTADTIILNYELSNNDLELNNLDTFVLNLNSYRDTVLFFEDSVDFSAFDQDFYMKVSVDSSNDNTYNLNDTLINIYTINHFIISKVIDSIIIDGRPDDEWNNYIYENLSFIQGEMPENDSDISAKYKSAWDTSGIYFLIKITDNYLYSEHEDDWQNDCVELFFDINNSKSNVYENKDFQIRLIWNIDEVNSGDINSLCNGGASSIEFAQIDTLEGYIFEVKFPWPVLCLADPINNQLIGFEIQVIDNDGAESETRLLWNDTLGIAWQNTSVFGTIRFLDEQITCKSDTTNIIDTICNGENVQIGELIFTENGNYIVNLTNQCGCDSVVNLALTVNPVDLTELTETFCEGESIQIGDSIFTETGNYSVTLTNQYGCDSIINLALNVNQNPNVALGADTTIYFSDSLILDAGNGFETYEWSNSETTQKIVVDSLAGIGVHTFSVIVSDINNCFGFDTIIIIIEQTTRIISFSETLGVIKLYPNPTNGKISIEIENIQDKTNILIYSETGQIIFSKQFESISNSVIEQIDLSNYSSGTYIIKVINNDIIKTERFILKK